MHIVTLTTPVARADGQEIPPGRYLLDNLNAAELMVAAERGTSWADHWGGSAVPDSYRGKNVVIIHPGGFGDQFLLEPVIRALRLAGAGWITLSCRPHTRCVFDASTEPDDFAEYPFPVAKLAGYDAVLVGENLNEIDPLGRTMHATDAKAKRWNIPFDLPVADKRPRYTVTEEELASALERYPKGKNARGPELRLGVQLNSSAVNRDYPAAMMGRVMEDFFVRGWSIFIFGSPGSFPSDKIPPPSRHRIHNLTAERLGFRASMAVASTCDLFITPDSAWLHGCGAIGVPCVALFGPIAAPLRTAYYPSVIGLQHRWTEDKPGEGCKIGPCYFHQRSTAGGLYAFPIGGPCSKSHRCESIAAITPAEVVTAGIAAAKLDAPVQA